MHTTNFALNPFLTGPQIFQLSGGYRGYGDTTGTVPCNIKVGPRRMLKKRIYPALCKVTFWAPGDGHPIYAHDLDPELTEKDGELFFDAPAFLKKHGFPVSYCSSDYYKALKKTGHHTGSFMEGPCGLAFAHETWLDISIYSSALYFGQDALRLCGRNVRTIRWRTFAESAWAPNDPVRSLVAATLAEPHALGAADFWEKIAACGDLTKDWLSCSVKTDLGSYSAAFDLGSDTGVTAVIGDTEIFIPLGRDQKAEAVRLMLRLMQARNAEAAKTYAAKFKMLRLGGKLPPIHLD